MSEDSEDSWEDYQSGPFCRHWGDPSECERKCARCSHACCRHDVGTDTECFEDGCECPAWVESEET